jgi:hypothetical protein
VNITYDPIKQVVEPRPVRVLTRLSTPAIDTALVLEPVSGDPVLVQAGEKVPGAFVGRYRRAALVDLRRYTLVLSENDLPSADPAFTFSVVLTFNCQVTNPIEVVRSGVRDMTAGMRPGLVGVLQDVVQEYDIAQFVQAKQALTRALGSLSFLNVSVGGYLVELSSSSGYHDTTRDIRIERIRRGAMRDVVDGGHRELVAQHLVKSDGDPTKLLMMEAAAVERDKDRVADVLRATSDEDADPVDTRDVRRRLYGKMLGESAPPPPERKRLSRRDHLAARGVRAADPKSSTEDSLAPRTRREPSTAPIDPEPRPASGERTSRLRGSAANRSREGES